MNDGNVEYLPNPQAEPVSDTECAEAMRAAGMRLGEFDPLAATTEVLEPDLAANRELAKPSSGKRGSLIQFYTPTQLKAYEPPPNQNMIGDYHLQRGAPSVLAGPPGCGKSRAALWLALLGAQGGGDWFGMKIRGQFRTLILQNENGLSRLHRDMAQIPPIDGLDDWLRISAPPVYGLALQNPTFRAEMKAMMKDFEPHLLIVDPWNACVRDAMEKDYQEGLSRLREIVAESPNEPAWLILHHLRKPKSEDRHKGRNLANLLNGSYVLTSVARSVIVMQPASDDVQDARVVITCAKNNDGALGARTAWERKDGLLFVPVPNFNFDEFDGGTVSHEPSVKEEHIREVFDGGRYQLVIKQAKERLMEIAGVGKSTAYEALKREGGRFSHLLSYDAGAGLISLKAAETDEPL